MNINLKTRNKMRKSTIKLINQFIYRLFYLPGFTIFWVFCKMQGEQGREYWDNVKFSPFNILVSLLWWVMIGMVILALILNVTCNMGA